MIHERRYAEEVEAAAYFFVCEALANVLKHAAAEHVDIYIDERDGELLVAVTDDGVGFDPSNYPQSGLRGLRDRIEAVGGRLEIRSHPARGTELTAHLPPARPQP